MGFLDRFKKQDSGNGNEPKPDTPADAHLDDDPDDEPDDHDRWDGSVVDWSATGLTEDEVERAAEIADTPDFGVDPSDEDGFRWLVASSSTSAAPSTVTTWPSVS